MQLCILYFTQYEDTFENPHFCKLFFLKTPSASPSVSIDAQNCNKITNETHAIIIIQGEFFDWSHPKSSKYGTGPNKYLKNI